LDLKIAILLSTYNGGKYLAQQLDSILNQNEFHGSYTLFIRDDGSSDKTIEIISQYRNNNNQIEWINEHGSKENLGAKESYFRMLQIISDREEYDYFMFCDQDDVWLSNKIEITISEAMKYNYDRPLLVHTDLIVADSEMKVLSDSFWKYQKISPTRDNLNHLLVQNVVTGCTVLMNKKLAKYSNIITSSSNVIMHDWWFALTACLFGDIKSVNISTIYYRQHPNNTLGANRYSFSTFYRKLFKKNNELELIRQAEELILAFSAYMNTEQLEMLRGFVSCRGSWATKLYMITKFRFTKYGYIRNFAWMFRKIK
jgi:glycosyltransferase involved in cell wall biosynthesis